MPTTNNTAIGGMYRYISLRTPVRDVNVELPVKFSARYAVTGGMASR